ncbi:MAG TPA: hypothetical protein VFA03_05515 [Acetobacteraceae bacterium]|nr:hypothetical protein [Acetobacteraceae bacterium]
MRRTLSKLLPILIGLAGLGGTARAEPPIFAIMGVRLYMSAEDVLTALYAQGVKPDAVTETVHPCALHAAVTCTTLIEAPLPDGVLEIRFTDAPPGFNDGREAAMAVSYTLERNPPHGDAVRLSAEERFGLLHEATNGVWCAPPAAPDCPPDRPRMSVTNRADGRVVLALTDLGLGARLGVVPLR